MTPSPCAVSRHEPQDHLLSRPAARRLRADERAHPAEADRRRLSYEHPSPVWQALAFVVYRLIMTPFLFLYCKLVFGLRIENRDDAARAARRLFSLR
ncbi:MAG: hypothetical protein ACLSHG_01460 [Oscillospiraceae bacterium]